MHDIFYINSVKDKNYNLLKDRFFTAKFAASVYEAQKKAVTKFFYIVYPDIIIDSSFNFDYVPDAYSQNVPHVFLNGKFYDGIALVPKSYQFSNNEINYRFFANKKEIDIVASTPTFNDIIFISYDEVNADSNFEKLLKRFPNVKRIHGVKGIHRAHIEAAKISSTRMLWIVDADAEIMNDFNFDFQVATWDQDIVHVFRSQNPINDLVYGYGGVKLFPRELTLNMDTSKPDMTTSISSKFRAVNKISNITAFNTDEFSTWKSAFRECCKLSSKVIDRQKSKETEERLDVWCSVGKDKQYGEYAIAGAKAGRDYGYENKDNVEALKQINDFDWLKNFYDKYY